MAQNMVSGFVDPGFVNKQRVKADSNIGDETDLTTPANYASIDALDARLKVINAAYYTNARLDKMTLNDKVYAVRVADDADTI